MAKNRFISQGLQWTKIGTTTGNTSINISNYSEICFSLRVSEGTPVFAASGDIPFSPILTMLLKTAEYYRFPSFVMQTANIVFYFDGTSMNLHSVSFNGNDYLSRATVDWYGHT